VSGLFVAVEGPNGVGKTTVIAEVAQLLEAKHGLAVHPTREPSATALGEAIRALEGSLPPEALAFACAADRLDHVAREIEPALGRGDYVLSDRYVPSSLVLQRLDGLKRELIWEINKTARVPDLTVYLDDEEETLARRLADRPKRSRFESRDAVGRERALYREAHDFLAERGWRQAVIDCRGLSPEAAGAELARLVAAAGRGVDS
jgi:dTMP kinase